MWKNSVQLGSNLWKGWGTDGGCSLGDKEDSCWKSPTLVICPEQPISIHWIYGTFLDMESILDVAQLAKNWRPDKPRS